jgi:hypothetical protein
MACPTTTKWGEEEWLVHIMDEERIITYIINNWKKEIDRSD